MAKPDSELHQECMERFIKLANTMKDEGITINVVSAGLMTSSAVYATFVAAGNDGGLSDTGIGKVTEHYRQQLEQVQEAKKTTQNS
ncbi:MAG: DUF3144 domain-containing protein [Halioglobus sp.]